MSHIECAHGENMKQEKESHFNTFEGRYLETIKGGFNEHQSRSQCRLNMKLTSSKLA